MYRIAEMFFSRALSAKQNRSAFSGFILPMVLAVAATLIKRFLFADTGQAVPFLLYFLVIVISGAYGGSRAALNSLPAIVISAVVGLSGLHSHTYLLLEWLFFIAEGLFVATLFFVAERFITELQLKEERFRRIIDQSAEGFILCDTNNIVTYCCPWVARLLSQHPEQRPLADIIAAADLQHFHYAMAKLNLNGGSMIIKLRLKQNAEQQIWTECCFNNLLNDPVVNSVIVQMRDISRRVDQEKQREDFIHMASHELKTPVTAIRGFLQISAKRLKDGKMEGFQQCLDRMGVQTERILNLVDEMLNVTRVKAGEMSYHPEKFDLRASIREVVVAVQAANNTHRIDALLPTEPVIIYGDETRIGQVVNNLLNNAIKYSPGCERVQLEMEVGPEQVTVSVKDEGIGIPKDKLKRIFDRFYRVDTLPKGQFVGLGLGLFIASDIVYHHKGKLTVDSDEGKGSVFRFSLPLLGGNL